MSAGLNIEALAERLAWANVHDHVYGDHWYGYPDPDDAAQMREAFEERLDEARKTARGYVAILTGVCELCDARADRPGDNDHCVWGGEPHAWHECGNHLRTSFVDTNCPHA